MARKLFYMCLLIKQDPVRHFLTLSCWQKFPGLPHVMNGSCSDLYHPPVSEAGIGMHIVMLKV